VQVFEFIARFIAVLQRATHLRSELGANFNEIVTLGSFAHQLVLIEFRSTGGLRGAA
jgi:hypothetical protein